MNTSNQMQAVAAQAAIGQERVTQRVEFAITGDVETDFIAAVNACFRSFADMPKDDVQQRHLGDGNRMAQRVCEYLAARFKRQAEVNEEQQGKLDQLQRFQQMSSLPAPDRTTTPLPKTWNDYITTGGTAVLAGMAGELFPTAQAKEEFLEKVREHMLREKRIAELAAKPDGTLTNDEMWDWHRHQLHKAKTQSGTHSPSTHCPDSAGSAPNGGGSSASFADVLRSLPDIEPEKPCSAPGPMGWPVDDHH